MIFWQLIQGLISIMLIIGFIIGLIKGKPISTDIIQYFIILLTYSTVMLIDKKIDRKNEKKDK